MEDLGKRVMAGDMRAASRLIRNIEDNIPGTSLAIKHIFPHTGRAHVIGFTGSPGAGKSTITDELIMAIRKKEKTVGVMAVDPTSPFTGGALLGDRIRMLRHAEDPGVFIRSLATRGAMGGLSKAVGDGIHVLDVMGKDVVIIETVGVGQQEVDIINHAHTVIVVLVPGLGDEVQAIKAGLMEIADIFVINKADRDGANKLYKETRNMIAMGKWENGWEPPVLMLENVMEPHSFAKSVEKLYDKIEEHYQHLIAKDMLAERAHRKVVTEMNDALQAAIMEPILGKLIADKELDSMLAQLMTKQSDPYSLAETVAEKYLKDSCSNCQVKKQLLLESGAGNF
ncbi:MAG TPA: methylmalonyl Co-A mutase-associated GTPase MeaB [Syntrophomonadaceae bacterium]|nr:methylmalonyl Co-A mutase-associated GTPase MeaB [Syntrophomonadaceae bacterium]